MDINIQAIKTLAEAAKAEHPGKWEYNEHDWVWASSKGWGGATPVFTRKSYGGRESLQAVDGVGAMRFVAAVDPDTIIALAERILELEAQLRSAYDADEFNDL